VPAPAGTARPESGLEAWARTVHSRAQPDDQNTRAKAKATDQNPRPRRQGHPKSASRAASPAARRPTTTSHPHAPPRPTPPKANGCGVSNPTPITAESGLSTGSIYAHYRSKADLVQATARATPAKRAEVLDEYAQAENPPDPDELLARMTSAINPTEARLGVQIWAEATTDPVIGRIVTDMIDRFRLMVHDCTTAWLVKAEGGDPAAAREQAAPIARRVIALYLAELLRTALPPPTEETSS
jgi:AcrR family transcriptional regulator